MSTGQPMSSPESQLKIAAIRNIWQLARRLTAYNFIPSASRNVWSSGHAAESLKTRLPTVEPELYLAELDDQSTHRQVRFFGFTCTTLPQSTQSFAIYQCFSTSPPLSNSCTPTQPYGHESPQLRVQILRHQL
ncbi:hypothetical protein Slin15195_G130210 [Septoria linicola]|uniref:Uncharacterized protein n=1 Tax=Septoria linicola TaxID=215465 RepID=A0A9Q9ERA5_9PEZI|nr:hypothetical protein Slin14017_G122100 [Septoria linicola]USW59702.1 hypothetical protein Slin15195_G130210 [Septoria linicola]